MCPIYDIQYVFIQKVGFPCVFRVLFGPSISPTSEMLQADQPRLAQRVEVSMSLRCLC